MRLHGRCVQEWLGSASTPLRGVQVCAEYAFILEQHLYHRVVYISHVLKCLPRPPLTQRPKPFPNLIGASATGLEAHPPAARSSKASDCAACASVIYAYVVSWIPSPSEISANTNTVQTMATSLNRQTDHFPLRIAILRCTFAGAFMVISQNATPPNCAAERV